VACSRQVCSAAQSASLFWLALLVPLPWSILVAVALVGAELALYRRLRPFDRNDER